MCLEKIPIVKAVIIGERRDTYRKVRFLNFISDTSIL